MQSENIDLAKRQAGEAAVDRYVRDGMCVGLGTGTTAYWAIRRVGTMVKDGASIAAVCTSISTEELCREAGITVVGLLEREISVAIDGADEVAPDFSLIKGAGGALLREKAVALAAKIFVVVVDERKIVDQLGGVPVPVEVVPFTRPWVTREIERAYSHAEVVLRGGPAMPYKTDNNNVILDCRFGKIAHPGRLDAALKAIHGVVDTGLFVDMTSIVFVGGTADLTRREARWFAQAGYTD
jgi:ribose 5-phosphate isomerase A